MQNNGKVARETGKLPAIGKKNDYFFIIEQIESK